MAYKILYIEDLKPESILHELKQAGFEAEHYNPENLDELLTKAKDFDLLLLDFRLTESKISVDAPTIAQAIRTINSDTHMDKPIVLISQESKISDYYKDYSSQGLFDFSVSKETFGKQLDMFSKRLAGSINAYNLVVKNKRDIGSSLGLSPEDLKLIDYRIEESLSQAMFKDDVFAFCNFILNNLIRSIGPLIGEDVLSARLGVSLGSQGWNQLKKEFDFCKYTGIYSEAYDRWWYFGVDKWWKEKSKLESLRRLGAEKRVEIISELTDIKELKTKTKLPHASSSNFWTIDKSTNRALDPIDGLELHKKLLFPWQEKEYISMNSALEASPLLSYVKSADKELYREYAKSIKQV